MDKKVDYIPAVGKRKRAIARIRVLNKAVKGIDIIINEKDYKDYLPYIEWQNTILEPLKLVGRDNIAITIKIFGGGIRGQVDAIRHGIAKALLMDNDLMVQKGYGWMLKEASKCHQKQVFDLVMSNKDKMPRTALRYAIELMPKQLKTKAMKK